MTREKGFAPVLIVLIVLAIIAVVLLGKDKLNSFITFPSPIPSTSQIDTSNWKTYLAKEGFSYKYPASWITPWANCGMPTPVPGELGHGRGPIGANCAETIVVTQEQIGSVDEANMPPTLCPNLVSETQIMIDGLDAKRKLWGADSPDKKIRCYEVWIYKDKKPILLWASSIGPDTDTNNINKLILTLDQILSTFKFTNKNQTTCILRPACLDSNPRCLIAEPISGWCK